MSEPASRDVDDAPPGQSFDLHIAEVARLVEELGAAGRPTRVWHARGEADALLEKLPMRVGPGAHSGLILRKDVFAELGSPDAGSCPLLLWTRRSELIEDGRITLVGPGLQESEGASLPFGQVVMVGGEALDKGDQSALELKQFVANQIEGYMIRRAPGRLWSRVGREIAGKGFDFEALGAALIAIFKGELPKIRTMQVLFVTSGREDVERLGEIAEEASLIGAELAKEAWRAKGFDPAACSVSHDCGSCSEQQDCDDIREVVLLRRQAKRAAQSAKKAKRAEG